MRSIRSRLILLTTYLEVVKLKRDVSSRTQRCTEATDQRNSPTLMTLKVCTHDALFVFVNRAREGSPLFQNAYC